MSIEVEVGGIYEAAADLTPSGAVIAFAGVNAPCGWLLCDGTAINRVTYSRLFDAIGINFGEGDGNTTFNLPDLQGYFIRGRDNGTGNDHDAASRIASNTGGNTGDNVGSMQDSAMWGHWHNFKPSTGYASVQGTVGGRNGPQYESDEFITNAIDDGIHGSPKLSSESRPKNISMNYIIKI